MQEIKRSSRGFQFVDTAVNAVTNDRYLAGYKQYSNGELNDDSYLWYALSAVAQDAGETIY